MSRDLAELDREYLLHKLEEEAARKRDQVPPQLPRLPENPIQPKPPTPSPVSTAELRKLERYQVPEATKPEEPVQQENQEVIPAAEEAVPELPQAIKADNAELPKLPVKEPEAAVSAEESETKKPETEPDQPEQTKEEPEKPEEKAAAAEAEATEEETEEEPEKPREETESEGADEEPEPKEKSKPKHKGAFVRFLIRLVLIGAILWAAFTFVFGLHIQTGNRMYPFVMDGDLIVLYRLDEYRLGDVVLYRRPDTGEISVSRIAAMGSSTIEITDAGEFVLDGFVPDDTVFYRTEKLEGSAVQFPYQMTDEGFFLLDDYRTEGNDSRIFGEVQRDALLGKAVYILRRRGI